MADECDFDTLAAMLDSDEEMNNEGEAGDGAAENAAESSDDDIDDDELDRLAGLVEQEEQSASNVKNEANDDEADIDQLLVELEDSDDEGPGEETKENFASSDAAVGHMMENNEEDADIQDAEDEEVEEEEDASVAEQLAKMREQIKLLEAQVKKKGTKKSKTSEEKKPITDTKPLREHVQIKQEKTSQVTSVCSKKNLQTVTVVNKTSITKQVIQPSSRNVFESLGKKEPASSERADKPPSSASKKRPSIGSSPRLKSPKGSSQHSGTPSQRKKEGSAKLLEMDIFGEDFKPSNEPAVSSSRMTSSKPSASSQPSIAASQTGRSGGQARPDHRSPSANSAAKAPVLSAPRSADDSDSDWEDLDGERCGQLSKPGNEIKSLLKKTAGGPGQRVAHVPKVDASQLQNRKPTWGASGPKEASAPKAASSPSSDSRNFLSSSPQVRQASSNDDRDREQFSGIRIVKPLIPSVTMKSRMEGRKMIRMSNLHKRVNTADMDADWVTMGVIVSKSEPKMSAKGKQFSIWTLSDLEDCEKEVKLFLFGDVHKEKWKTSIGQVVGVLNASVMKNNEKYQNRQNEVCLTLDNALKIMDMGASRDFAICKAKTKAGRNCHHFINRSHGEYCSFHVQAMYKRMSAKRGDIQSGHTGVVPKSFEQVIASKKEGTVFYGGQSFSTGKSLPSQQKKGVSLKGLQHHQKVGTAGKAKITTLALHDILPEDRQQLNDIKIKKEAEKHEAFHDLLTTPTVGSMNLVKHLVKKETEGKNDQSSNKKITVQSIKASDMIKQMKAEFKASRQAAARPSTSSTQPRLSGGPNVDVIFDFDSPLSMKPLMPRSNPELAKKRAIEKLRSKGGIAKEDPNAVKKVQSADHKERIKKRVAEQLSSDSAEENQGPESQSKSSAPPKKKSRYLGELELDNKEVQKLLQASSKYDNQLTEAEQERFDEYFDVGEKKEQMEQKMASISEQKCKAVTCKQCQYTSQYPAARCKEERHTLKWHDAVKRFFKCTHCKKRCSSLQRYPNEPCRGCGGTKYERSVMREERKGPALPNEELLTRGEELKFLNSLQG